MAKSQDAKKNVKKVIGIQLKSSLASKDIPIITYKNLITKMLNEQEYYPILLIAPTDEEKQLVNDINKYFDNKLISVATDFKAISALILALDAIITPDTVIKHIAELIETPVLEVALGPAPIYKQGLSISGNLILSPKINCFPCSFKHNCKKPICKSLINEEDIYVALNFLLHSDAPSLQNLTGNSSLYFVSRDENGIKYNELNPNIDHSHNLIYLVNRQITNIVLQKDFNDKFDEAINALNFDKNIIENVIKDEKNNAIELSKLILSIIKSLKSTSKHDSKVFMNSLDTLLQYKTKKTLFSLPVHLFQAEFENTSLGDPKENRVKIEQLLYKMKSHVKNITMFIYKLENIVFKSGKKYGKATI